MTNTPSTRQSGLGTRFDFQQYEAGQKGGLQWYPLSGVESGMSVTAGVVTATEVPLTIWSGQLRLDGTLVESDASINYSIAGTGFDLASEQKFVLYANPTRKYPALNVAPGSPNSGDIYLKVQEVDWYYVLQRAEKYNGTIWEKYDLAKAPIGYGHNNMIMGDILNDFSIDNISTEPEKMIFLPTQYPVYVSSTPHAFFRASASCILAEITVANLTATVRTRVDVANL